MADLGKAAYDLAAKAIQGLMSFDVRAFGAKCDGGASQSGSISTSADITDTTPPILLPIDGQPITWVGLGAAIGGGITGITMSASGSYPVVTTASSHFLANGQLVTISGVLGALQANGVWSVVVLTATTFQIRLNTSVFDTYTSGGIVQPTLSVFGYVKNPVVSGGTLTCTIVTTPGGTTPATIPSGLASTGTYYFGSDDTAAWNLAIAKASSVGTTIANPVRVTWSGTSMVSSTIIADGNVLIVGDHNDYTNPDGTNSASTLPTRGSILRPHGNFANKLTSSLLQLGTVVNTTSGKAGTSTLFGTYDAANFLRDAVHTLGSRNFIERTYALNGVQNAYSWEGSNTVGISPIAGMSNTGNGLYINASDCKWYGGYIRQATNAIRILNGADIAIGGGVHIFNGYNGGNEKPGNDILIDAALGDVHNVILGEILYDGVVGPHIRIAPAANKSVYLINIVGGVFFQPQTLANQAYSVVELDTTQTSSLVYDVSIQAYMANGYYTTASYKSILNSIGTGFSRINLGDGNARYCATHYTGQRPTAIGGGSLIFNGTSTKVSEARGTATFAGTGSQTQFLIAHSLSTIPNDVVISPMNAASSGATVDCDATNIIINFATAPANLASLKFGYRAGI